MNSLLNRMAGRRLWLGWWPAIIAALLIGLVVESQTEAVYSFFQSPPQSPVLPTDTPPPPPPTNTPPPPPTNTPPPPPTNTPPPEATNTSEPAPTDTPAGAEPTNTVAELPTNTPLPPQPEATPTPTATPQPTIDNAAAGTAPTLTPPPPTVPPVEVLVGEEQAEASGVVVNEVELIDTVVEWFAYLWLCVGVAIILVVPFIFLFLQVRGKQLNR